MALDKGLIWTLAAADSLLFLLGCWGIGQHRLLGAVVVLLSLWFAYKTFKYAKG